MHAEQFHVQCSSHVKSQHTTLQLVININNSGGSNSSSSSEQLLQFMQARAL
jgi:hypothetical protein